jgi:hypothetical protein
MVRPELVIGAKKLSLTTVGEATACLRTVAQWRGGLAGRQGHPFDVFRRVYNHPQPQAKRSRYANGPAIQPRSESSGPLHVASTDRAGWL